jgi:hypothetical protein
VLHLIFHRKLISFHRLLLWQMREFHVVLTKRKTKRLIKIFSLWNFLTLSLDGSVRVIFWKLQSWQIHVQIASLREFDVIRDRSLSTEKWRIFQRQKLLVTVLHLVIHTRIIFLHYFYMRQIMKFHVVLTK